VLGRCIKHCTAIPARYRAPDKSALQLALELRKQSIADALIEHGADPSRRDPDGRPLLIWAIEQGDWFAANYLLEHGTDVEAYLPTSGRRPIHVRAGQNPNKELSLCR